MDNYIERQSAVEAEISRKHKIILQYSAMLDALDDAREKLMAPHKDAYNAALDQADLVYDTAINEIRHREFGYDSPEEEEKLFEVRNAAVEAAVDKFEPAKKEIDGRFDPVIKMIRAQRDAELAER
jgi:hypothetical protein